MFLGKKRSFKTIFNDSKQMCGNFYGFPGIYSIDHSQSKTSFLSQFWLLERKNVGDFIDMISV